MAEWKSGVNLLFTKRKGHELLKPPFRSSCVRVGIDPGPFTMMPIPVFVGLVDLKYLPGC
jgi:hypothetical protein